MITGAEKSRPREGIGASGTVTKRNTGSCARSARTRLLRCGLASPPRCRAMSWRLAPSAPSCGGRLTSGRPARRREGGRVRTHLLNARHRFRIHVAGVLLFPKDGQPFLERQLKPVAACDPVSGPVVEILVRDGPVDEAKIEVGGDIGPGQHQLGVEDV